MREVVRAAIPADEQIAVTRVDTALECANVVLQLAYNTIHSRQTVLLKDHNAMLSPSDDQFLEVRPDGLRRRAPLAFENERNRHDTAVPQIEPYEVIEKLSLAVRGRASRATGVQRPGLREGRNAAFD